MPINSLHKKPQNSPKDVLVKRMPVHNTTNTKHAQKNEARNVLTTNKRHN